MFDNIHDMDNVNFLCSSGGQLLVVARSPYQWLMVGNKTVWGHSGTLL